MTPDHEVRRRGGQVASKQPECNTRTGMQNVSTVAWRQRNKQQCPFRGRRCQNEVWWQGGGEVFRQPACRARLNASRWLWTDLGECRPGGEGQDTLSTLCPSASGTVSWRDMRRGLWRWGKKPAVAGDKPLLVVLRTWTWFIAPNSTGSLEVSK